LHQTHQPPHFGDALGHGIVLIEIVGVQGVGLYGKQPIEIGVG